MKIYTSYYANLRKIPDDIVRISIAGKAPAWYTGLQYKKYCTQNWILLRMEEKQRRQLLYRTL